MMVWDQNFGQIFTGPVVVVLCISGFLMWLLWNMRAGLLADSLEEVTREKSISSTGSSTSGLRLSAQLVRQNTLSTQRSTMNSRAKSCATDKSFVPMCSRSKTFGPSYSSSKSFGPTNSGAGSAAASVTNSLQGFSLSNSERRTRNLEDPNALPCYRKKLQRRVVYSLVATTCGLGLLLSIVGSSTPWEDLLVSFSSAHQTIFAMAVGHWANALWEDFRSQQFLVQSTTRDRLLCFPSGFALKCFYFAYSTVSLFVFVFILATHTLSGLGVQCLVFEAPMVLLTWRELLITQVPVPVWWCEERGVRMHWRLTSLIFTLARGPAMILWICSLIPGIGAELLEKSLGATEQIVYHFLAACFFFFNMALIALMFCWSREDAAKAETESFRLEEATESEAKLQRASDEKADDRVVSWGDASKQVLLPADRSSLRTTSTSSSDLRHSRSQEGDDAGQPQGSEPAVFQL